MWTLWKMWTKIDDPLDKILAAVFAWAVGVVTIGLIILVWWRMYCGCCNA